MKKEKKSTIEKIGGVINLFGNAILMNLIFLAACLPIVTIGQAWCGLLGAIRYNIRGESWFAGFKTGYKTRFLRGTIIWCLGLVVCFFLMNDINQAMVAKANTMLPFSWAMFAFAAMIVQSALLLNVYIYTNVNNWIKNMVNLLFKGFIPLLICTALFWAPIVVVFLFNAWIVYECAMILLCAYFAAIALVFTMTMKGHLTDMLLQCRADGLIIAEEGQQKDPDEESGE